jgi:hypothetical protein
MLLCKRRLLISMTKKILALISAIIAGGVGIAFTSSIQAAHAAAFN